MPNEPERLLRDVVMAAIDEQMPAGVGGSLEEDVEAQRNTAEQLVREALGSGQISPSQLTHIERFERGNTAMLVARVDTTLSFVVKVDRSRDLVAEAHLLRRIASDTALPTELRCAFPKIYAIDDEGPIYGYLMEDLSSFQPLVSAFSGEHHARREHVVETLWTTVLEPAYRSSRQTRLAPNVAEDFFERAETRLNAAVTAGILVPGDKPLRILDLELPDGWAPLLKQAEELLVTCLPTFGTFVHGDPNPENILYKEQNEQFQFKLIDPKAWYIGDYLFDVAKLTHYLRLTEPVERQRLKVEGAEIEGTFMIDYDEVPLRGHESVERVLLRLVRSFAEHPEVADCKNWRIRYDLAVAANLLAIAGPRLKRQDRAVGLMAFAEGLRALDRTLKAR